jgi:pyruvate,water dikinase
VIASARAAHVASYRAGAGRTDDIASAPLGVLVQRLVHAEAAGVVFTANPVSGDDEIVIETTRGLGDRLMAGDVVGDRWVERDGRLHPEIDSGVIDVAVAQRVVALARRIASERRAPQDVEWAFEGGELHVLQARPITALPTKPQIEIPPGRWMKDTGHFTGPMTPIGASILLPVYEAAVASGICREYGLPMETIRMRSFGGEVYTQDVELGGKHNPGAPPPWWLIGIVFRVVPELRKCMKLIEQALPKLVEDPRLWESTWRSECLARIEASRAVDLRALDDDALCAELQRVIDELLAPHMKLHFRLTVPHIVGVYELVKCCEEMLGWDMPRAMSLLGGSSTTTTAPDRAMAAIAAQLDPSIADQGIEAVRASAVGAQLDAWLEHWGLRTIDSDPGSSLIADRPALVLGLLRSSRAASKSIDAQRASAIEEARSTLEGAARERFERALAYAEVVYPLREDNVPYTEGLPSGLVRRALDEIGRRLCERGALHAADDVVYLVQGELRDALSGHLRGETAAQRARRRRAERAWVHAHPGPAFHGPAPAPMPDMRGLPAAGRRIMSAAMWSMQHELAPPEARSHDAGCLTGVGASPGSYTGRVRVIMHEGQLERLQPGEVLVCPTTHSTWSLVFARAGALVTDGGGLMAHPAIIAREHGIPAVLATCTATSTLRDGQTVTVDGASGRVRIH